MRRMPRWVWIACIVFVLGVGQNVAPRVACAAKPSGILRAMGDEIADIVQKARPAVVRIESTTIVKPGGPGDPRRYF